MGYVFLAAFGIAVVMFYSWVFKKDHKEHNENIVDSTQNVKTFTDKEWEEAHDTNRRMKRVSIFTQEKKKIRRSFAKFIKKQKLIVNNFYNNGADISIEHKTVGNFFKIQNTMIPAHLIESIDITSFGSHPFIETETYSYLSLFDNPRYELIDSFRGFNLVSREGILTFTMSSGNIHNFKYPTEIIDAVQDECKKLWMK